MRRALFGLIALAVIGFGVFWWITTPERIDPGELQGLQGEAARGALVYAAGGCGSCHVAPNAPEDQALVLAGGQAFASPFGTFYAPNISPHQNGIGGWSLEELATAMRHGTSPEGTHYYPAFPYTSYVRASLQDIADLKAFLDALPPSEAENRPHDIGFPFNWRRLLGGWKWLYASDGPRVVLDDSLARGQYLVEGLGHCGECHTARDMFGGPRGSRWLAGAPNPTGEGRIPNITPHESGIASWSEAEIVEYLSSGFTPEFDVAGGEMAKVVANTGQLPDEDRAAIAAYLKAIPALERE